METTGRTVEEATRSALEHLGVADSDAEVQVLAEPRAGLFGRLRSEARVRARVRPSPVRPKLEDGRRPSGDRARRHRRRADARSEGDSGSGGATSAETGGEARPTRTRRSRRTDAPMIERRDRSAGTDLDDEDGAEVVRMDDEPTLEAQGAIGVSFIEGLLERFELSGTVRTEELDERTIQLSVDGDGLGVLIGRGGVTLAALQELTRTVVQRQTRVYYGRLLVDVGGYRERRRLALEEFVRSQVEQAKATGSERVLEPMTSADRKIVHDLVNTLDGVGTRSEGEEPRRRVVIFPDHAD
ncbi:MAG: Jag N-terminal domain-containing protein [Acidimicrobiales bacterium]|nr:Jag N-terminal domain-containing protein [Acidimicrobiales bacterium]